MDLVVAWGGQGRPTSYIWSCAKNTRAACFSRFLSLTPYIALHKNTIAYVRLRMDTIVRQLCFAPYMVCNEEHIIQGFYGVKNTVPRGHMSTAPKTELQLYVANVKQDLNRFMDEGKLTSVATKSCGCADYRFPDGTGIKFGSKECVQAATGANTEDDLFVEVLMAALKRPKKETTTKE